MRRPLANFDAQRLEPVSRRLVRTPPTKAGPERSPGSASFARSPGISRGSFWPSPSICAMTGKRAANIPDRRLALCPALVKCRTIRSFGSVRFSSESSETVASVEQSSTTTTSPSCASETASNVSRTNLPILPSSLKAGMTTEICMIFKRLAVGGGAEIAACRQAVRHHGSHIHHAAFAHRQLDLRRRKSHTRAEMARPVRNGRRVQVLTALKHQEQGA